jgi:hypothetical protein
MERSSCWHGKEAARRAQDGGLSSSKRPFGPQGETRATCTAVAGRRDHEPERMSNPIVPARSLPARITPPAESSPMRKICNFKQNNSNF